jgi:hypothetical protein
MLTCEDISNVGPQYADISATRQMSTESYNMSNRSIGVIPERNTATNRRALREPTDSFFRTP